MSSRTIDGLRLDCTCGACPEQYDVFEGDVKVGYMRLRHGFFRVYCPDYGYKTVYAAQSEGDGCFGSEEERSIHLERAVRAIRKHQRRIHEYFGNH